MLNRNNNTGLGSDPDFAKMTKDMNSMMWSMMTSPVGLATAFVALLVVLVQLSLVGGVVYFLVKFAATLV